MKVYTVIRGRFMHPLMMSILARKFLISDNNDAADRSGVSTKLPILVVL